MNKVKAVRTLQMRAPVGELVAAADPSTDGDRPSPRRFKMMAYTGGAMRLEGWPHPVVVDLAGMQVSAKSRPILKDHNPSLIVGHTESVRVEGSRLLVSGVISGAGRVAREIVESSLAGFPWQASLGASAEQVETIPKGSSAQANGNTFDGPVQVVRRSRLGEVSFVALGADDDTEARVAAAAGQRRNKRRHSMAATALRSGRNLASLLEDAIADRLGDEPEEGARGELLEQIADAAGISVATLNEILSGEINCPPIERLRGFSEVLDLRIGDMQRALEADGCGSSDASDDSSTTATARGCGCANMRAAASGGVVADLRAQAAAEAQRIADVRRLCAGRRDDIEANAIAEGWDAQRTELEILRADRPKVGGAPAIHTPENTVTSQVLEAACLLTAKLGGVESHCEPRALDVAAKRFRGGIGLQELLLEAAWANGYTGRSFRDSRTVLRFAFKPEVTAGFSTISIGGILSNVANKFLLEGFFSVERTWRNITAVRNVSDFKTVTSYRLVGKDQYERVAPGGELKHGDLGEEQYTNKADTYGLLLSIDRRDIVNDDLGAITTIPRKLGRGSGQKINDVFWTTFLNNAAFFSAANNNFLAGAQTALSIDGLTSVETAFMDQVDSDGKPIGIMPAILLAPTGLSAIGTQLFKSLELRDTTASTKFPIANPHQGKFRVEVSRYLGNAQYAGSSTKAWYLLAEPADLPVIETAFLNGQESPTIETAEADFNILGVQMRGYHDFGVNLQDPRGGVKAKGEA